MFEVTRQRRSSSWQLPLVRFVLMPVGEAMLFVLGGAVMLAKLGHQLNLDALAVSGLLLATVSAVLQRYADRLRSRSMIYACSIAVAGAAAMLICLAAGIVDTLTDPRRWLLPIVEWTAVGTALVMLARLFVAASWVGRFAQYGAADEAIVLSVDPNSNTAKAAAACLPTRLDRHLQLRLGRLPNAGDAPERAINALIETLRPLRPAEILLDFADLPTATAPSAVHPALLAALTTLPCRIWQAVPGATGPELVLLLDRPIDDVKGAVKRSVDVVGAITLLFLLSPLLLIVGVAIKLDAPGPMLFRQQRVGYNNELFEIFKFRSMHHAVCDVKGSRLTSRNDPRVTRIGRFIRRTSIDELPQLINVLRGEMSLVGPRPHPIDARVGQRPYGEVLQNIGRRHRVRPGMTGLAQISGYRGAIDTEERLIGRFKNDLDYIDRWSLWLDIKILMRTPLSGVFNADAY